MRIAFTLVTGLFLVQVSSAQAPAPAADAKTVARPPTMKELMLDLIYPTSDALFYVAREEPQNPADWSRVQVQALALQQAAIALTTPGQAYVYESCQSCHEHFRPGYRRRPS